MNERIKELALESGYLPDGFGIGHWDMPECKKFAELIIQECMEVSLKCSHRDDDMGAIIARQIKQHFGVEE
jgi:hypothetical protein